MRIEPDGAELSFAARLAAENGWSGRYAERVDAEYRRFLYLAATSDHPVTPSDEVDQAWHLHLAYTRSYWDELCGSILGRPLHHGPTAGGSAEREQYHEQYAMTLEAYECAFGSKPPVDVWPTVEQRFDSRHVRVDVKHFAPVDRRGMAVLACALGLAVLASLVGSTEFPALVMVSTIALIIMAMCGGLRLERRLPEKRGDDGSGDGCGTTDSGCGSGCGGGCGGD